MFPLLDAGTLEGTRSITGYFWSNSHDVWQDDIIA